MSGTGIAKRPHMNICLTKISEGRWKVPDRPAFRQTENDSADDTGSPQGDDEGGKRTRPTNVPFIHPTRLPANKPAINARGIGKTKP